MPILLFIVLAGTQAAARLRWKRVAALLTAALLGTGVMYMASAPPQALSADDEAGDNIVVTGTITDYEIKNKQIYYTIQLENGYHRTIAMVPVQNTKDISKLIKFYNKQEICIGMRVQAEGELRYFDAPTNPGQFDLQLYYKSKNVEFAIKDAELTVLDAHRAHLRSALRRLQLRLSFALEQMAEKEDAGVLSAMLFGEKSGLDEEIQGLYQRNGIAHVLAVSGLHVSLIGMGLYSLLRRCGCRISVSAILGIAVVAAFGFLSGNAVSAKRAVIMYSMMMAAQICGRTYDLPSALSLAALLVLLRQPFAIFQASMQLSFGAVSAFILFPQGLAQLLGKGRVRGDLPEREKKEPGLRGMITMRMRYFLETLRKKARSIPMGVGEGLFLSAKIQLVTAPLQAFHFYYLTPFSGFLNLLVIPGVSVLFICGMSAALCGFLAGIVPAAVSGVLWQIGLALLKPCSLLLSGYRLLCTLGEGLTGGMSVCGRPQTGMLFVYAAAVGLIAALPRSGAGVKNGRRLLGRTAVPAIWFMRKGNGQSGMDKRQTGKRFRLQLAAMLLLTLSMGSLLHAPPVHEMQVTMLDVGQGDSVVLELPGNICVLSDGGSSDVRDVGTYRIMPYLLSRGVDTLDLVLVSHWDADHISGVEELIEQNGQNITVKTMILPDAAAKDEKYKELVQEAEAAGINVRAIAAGASFTCPTQKEDVRFDCLAPDPAYIASDRNGYSAVYRVSYGKNHFLLTGDLPGEEEKRLFEEQTGSLMTETPQTDAASQMDAASEKESGEKKTTGGVSAQILKVAHHGSKYSTSVKFLEQVQPKVALISCGKDNSYGHPHAELLARLQKAGCRILITEQTGAISLQLDRSGTCSMKLGSQQPFARVFYRIVGAQSAK